MELNELPIEYGIQKNFSIQSIDPAAKLESILKRNIISYDCFNIEKGKRQGQHLIVILYKKGNKELLCLTYDQYRKYSRALKRKVDRKYI